MDEGKRPQPRTFSLTKKIARFTKDRALSLLRTQNCLTKGKFVVKKTGRGLVVNGLGSLVRTKSDLTKKGRFLSKAESVGVGAFSPHPT